jgi:hypothetical protein
LVAPFRDEKTTVLYGSYEVIDGRLKLALGTRRATRPLEFKPAAGVVFFNGQPGKPEGPVAKPVGDAHAELHRLLHAGDVVAGEKFLRQWLQPMTARDSAAAETFVRDNIPNWRRLRWGEEQLLLGIAVLERARKVDRPEAAKLCDEAVNLFGASVAAATGASSYSTHAMWIRTQAERRGLQALFFAGKSKELIVAAAPIATRHRESVDGLIALALMYHACKQTGESERAQKVRDEMKDRFDALKGTPGAFSATSGEYSRVYWEKEWFGEK